MSVDRPDLVEVLEHYGVQVNSYRVTQMVRCPLQDEDRTPSMSIDLKAGLWNCHSCGKGGDSFTLIMEKEGTTFVGARALAATLDLTAGSAGGSDDGVRGSAYGGRREVPDRTRHRTGRGGYIPAWRRH
ncbi:CHC2 zinc finger domain-containing protein [Salinispora pacifica]|uniref:CHC2 zinc finger domain-containing protein n=1 Tax=Salinispora pacifica TaxID=351187 RepID=UPI0005BB12F3